MEQLPSYAYAIFIATVAFASWLFLKATHYSRTAILVLVGWCSLQIILGVSDFYTDPTSLATRFPMLVGPPIVFLTALFCTRKGSSFIDGLDIRMLTIFHIIRIPVEITLLLLFLSHSIPRAMTFEGGNFDILSGLSAPVMFYFSFVKKVFSRLVLIIWNFVCIGLLLNVVGSAVLSLPGRSLSFGYEQPNVAVGYFPFLLLPSLLVPLALFSNAAAIMQLLRRKGEVVH